MSRISVSTMNSPSRVSRDYTFSAAPRLPDYFDNSLKMKLSPTDIELFGVIRGHQRSLRVLQLFFGVLCLAIVTVAVVLIVLNPFSTCILSAESFGEDVRCDPEKQTSTRNELAELDVNPAALSLDIRGSFECLPSNSFGFANLGSLSQITVLSFLLTDLESISSTAFHSFLVDDGRIVSGFESVEMVIFESDTVEELPNRLFSSVLFPNLEAVEISGSLISSLSEDLMDGAELGLIELRLTFCVQLEQPPEALLSRLQNLQILRFDESPRLEIRDDFFRDVQLVALTNLYMSGTLSASLECVGDFITRTGVPQNVEVEGFLC